MTARKSFRDIPYLDWGQIIRIERCEYGGWLARVGARDDCLSSSAFTNAEDLLAWLQQVTEFAITETINRERAEAQYQARPARF